jgi:hypothetical protein
MKSSGKPLFFFDEEFADEVMSHSWAGSGNGYLHATINHKQVLLHRFLWKLKSGEYPDQVDHINRIRVDNRMANLRQATYRLNNINRKGNPDNGLPKGVYHDKRLSKNPYRAQCCGKYLGRFSTPEEAFAAYQAAADAEILKEQQRIESGNA